MIKPELSNLFSFTSTGASNEHVVMSFYYEWKETEDGETFETNKIKTASILMNLNDMRQLSDALNNMFNEISDKGDDKNE